MEKKKPAASKRPPPSEKALLKVYVREDIVRRVRMMAGYEGKHVGDLVTELLDKALPDWKQK